jgi:transcriptional regulator of acetoin/glycerol metabolism
MGRSHDVAVPPGADPVALVRRLRRAHDAFVETGRADPRLRPLVAESWRRSVGEGLDPEASLPHIRLDDDGLAAARASHPLHTVMPVVRRLLVDPAAEAGLLVAVSDAAGRLLWVEGASALRSRAEGMNFVEGADWSEASAGTNAPGTALALDRPVQIFGPEHLARPVTPWSCSAAPIHDPDTGALLGVLDLTGGDEVAGAQSLSLVRATVAAVEAELRIERLSSGGPRAVAGWDAPRRLDVLGARAAVLHGDGSTTRLSARHGEILLLLASHPDGLTSAELSVALSDDEHAPVTVRAELSRLRAASAAPRLASRPYRLVEPLRTDLDEVRDALGAGELRRAVARYRGPVLPGSDAPGVVRLRARLHEQVRAAVLASHDADAVLTFADTDHARDDYDVWQHALEVLPPGSPRALQVAAHLDALDAELG